MIKIKLPSGAHLQSTVVGRYVVGVPFLVS
jgi:hypothetical protein